MRVCNELIFYYVIVTNMATYRGVMKEERYLHFLDKWNKEIEKINNSNYSDECKKKLLEDPMRKKERIKQEREKWLRRCEWKFD